jgi:uncharacterized protein (TIGR00255 family)
MIRSMTGFGAGRAKQGEEEISVEIRSVNGKFCEVKARLPRELMAFEVALVNQVKTRLARGGVDVYVRRLGGAGRSTLAPRADIALAKEYAQIYTQLGRDLGAPGGIPLAQILQAEGVITLEERPANPEDASQALTAAATLALDELVKMREQEGKALAEDLLARASLLRENAHHIAEKAPDMVAHYRDRLAIRVKELSQGIAVDPARLAQEVALFADRCDIAEELTRLSSHLDQFERLVLGDEPAGRRMEFLVQEMGREVNTTGSKSQSADIATTVVGLKAELERIKEQVANVE